MRKKTVSFSLRPGRDARAISRKGEAGLFSGFAARQTASVATAVAALVLGALPPASAAGSTVEGVTITGAWFRTIVPGRPAGGYFTLRNDSDIPRELIGAASPACGTAMLHRSVSEDGAKKMVHVEQVDVPPHGSITFAPGGYHIMCMKPTDAMKPGNTVSVTLEFADESKLAADFAVKSATAD